MSVVTIAEAWPAAGRPFTVAELDRMPDDGRRYELLSGALIVSPRPTTIHQVVAGRLCGTLSSACPELTVFEMGEGGYALVAKAAGSFAAGRPFTVSIDLADLTRGLPR